MVATTCGCADIVAKLATCPCDVTIVLSHVTISCAENHQQFLRVRSRCSRRLLTTDRCISSIFCGYSAEFYGWTAKTASIGTACRYIFRTSSTLFWKIRFKSEVAACADFASEAMSRIKEVEMVDSLYLMDKIFQILRGWTRRLLLLRIRSSRIPTLRRRSVSRNGRPKKCRQDTHSLYTSAQYSLFSYAERTPRALLKSSRISFQLCAGFAHVSPFVVLSPAVYNEHIIFIIHSSFYHDTRTRSTTGTTRATPGTPSTPCTSPSSLSRQAAPSRITLA